MRGFLSHTVRHSQWQSKALIHWALNVIMTKISRLFEIVGEDSLASGDYLHLIRSHDFKHRSRHECMNSSDLSGDYKGVHS